MRIKDLYSGTDKYLMLRGIPILFMKYLFKVVDPFYSDIGGVYNGYFLHSNNKLVSPAYLTYINSGISSNIVEFNNVDNIPTTNPIFPSQNVRLELSEEFTIQRERLILHITRYYDGMQTTETATSYYSAESDSLYDIVKIYIHRPSPLRDNPLSYSIYEKTKDTIFSLNGSDGADKIIADIIRSKFIKKWTDTYNVLATEFNPLNDFKRIEEISGQDKTSLKHGKSISKSVTDSGSFIHGEVIDREYKDRGNENTRTYTNYSVTNENINQNEGQDYVFGFNSSSEVSTDKSITKDASKDVTTYNGSYKDNTVMNGVESDTHSGTDTTSRSVTDTQTNSGTDEDTIEYGKQTQIEGYNENPTLNLQKALDFHAKNIFYDIIYDDIDSIITLSIY